MPPTTQPPDERENKRTFHTHSWVHTVAVTFETHTQSNHTTREGMLGWKWKLITTGWNHLLKGSNAYFEVCIQMTSAATYPFYAKPVKLTKNVLLSRWLHSVCY